MKPEGSVKKKKEEKKKKKKNPLDWNEFSFVGKKKTKLNPTSVGSVGSWNTL